MKRIVPTYKNIIWVLMLMTGCKNAEPSKESIPSPADRHTDKHLWHQENTYTSDSLVRIVIEIPAGTLEKWEVNKETGKSEWTYENGRPRIVQYLPYPGNYGMIPQTFLPVDEGGDGDPLDVIVLGPSVQRESIVEGKIIGMISLLDRGEQDDKMIAVDQNSPFWDISNLEGLKQNYPGSMDIIQTWFQNYKGGEMVVINGVSEAIAANKIVKKAHRAYQRHYSK